MRKEQTAIDGRLIETSDGPAYQIRNYDRMAPFLTTVVSDSDHWLYISSAGGLTAGRINADLALFPYHTADLLHEAHHHTGPCTILRFADEDGRPVIYEPFGDIRPTLPREAVRRSLTRTTLGHALRFEETRTDLGLSFAYAWRTSELFGFVRTCRLINTGSTPRTITLLDGLRNLNPTGVIQVMNQTRGPLADAYKLGEIDETTRLGVIALNAEIVDRPDPAERLSATLAWQHGLDPEAVLLTTDLIEAFGRGEPIQTDRRVRGRKLSYLTVARVTLAPGESRQWHTVADVDRGHAAAAGLRHCLAQTPDTQLDATIEADIAAGAARLEMLVGSADGRQLSYAGPTPGIDAAHHLANTTYNIMRGGVPVDGHRIDRNDFARLLAQRNRPLAEAVRTWLDGLSERLPREELVAAARSQAEAINDPSLLRLAMEYLPITFSRRHGDPSRPWNHFDIRVRDEAGRPILDYQGNWRDIFQNWEALCMSFPAFTEACIAAFANASTVDGHNPYRLTRAGIDWEICDPQDPWSFIGYWGDHQIIYLLKLLEWQQAIDPAALSRLLRQRCFTYADVPYRIKGYADLLTDPRDSITFDAPWDRRAKQRREKIGGDGLLRHDASGRLVHVNLAEKLIVAALAKLANLVLDGGIWMNTQRPEWNDANNALAGWGLSMVTLNYLRRHLRFLRPLFQGLGDRPIELSGRVAEWLTQTLTTLEAHAALADRPQHTPAERRALLDAMGQAAQAYREAVYDGPLGDAEPTDPARLIELCDRALPLLEQAIQSSRRDDGLYEAYNVLSTDADGGLVVHALAPMLEGQVAVMSSGLLDSAESLRLIETMYTSPLYRADQDSFLLYPDQDVEPWLERNVIPDDAPTLLAATADAGVTALAARDAQGRLRFGKHLHNARDVAGVLDDLARDPHWQTAVARDRHAVIDTFERVFAHRSFTGRSGRMFGFEGLGSIYWHMVAKLLLAVQETYWRAADAGEDAATLARLAAAYYRVRGGLGFHKTPAEYGTFPTEPYSHSPAFAGAQQPGMTGQVKEEIIARWGELGLRVAEGKIRIDPRLLRREEFSPADASFTFIDPNGRRQTIDVPSHGLAFTFCQTPIVYHLGEADHPTPIDASASRAILQRHNVPPLTITIPTAMLIDRSASNSA